MRRLTICLVVLATLAPLGARADAPTEDCGVSSCISADIHAVVACGGGSGTRACSATIRWEATLSSDLPIASMTIRRRAILCTQEGGLMRCDLVAQEESRCNAGRIPCTESGAIALGFAVPAGCQTGYLWTDVEASEIDHDLAYETREHDLLARVLDTSAHLIPACAT